MACYMFDLLTVWDDCLNTQQREDAYKVLNIIKNAGIATVSPMSNKHQESSIYFREVNPISLTYMYMILTYLTYLQCGTRTLVAQIL